jgi:hypothetical protein
MTETQAPVGVVFERSHPTRYHTNSAVNKGFS